MRKTKLFLLLASIVLVLGLSVTWVAANGPVGNQAAEVVGTAPEPAGAAPGPLTGFVWPTAILYDNGGLVTHPGGGAGGADASALQTAIGLNVYGFGHAVTSGFRVADDFTVPAGGWTINTITFFAYQTGSTTTSTINNVNLRIWDGVPGAAGSNIVFGDTTTNRLAATSWSNIYRSIDTDLTASNRPIMADVATVNTFLGPGTYWVDWQTGGTLASGPWAPPVSILGQVNKPGSNALQFDGAAWNPLIDTGTAAAPQDLPFIIDGTAGTPTGADLGVTKVGGPDPAIQGDTLTYTMTVANAGPDPATMTILTDALPTGATFVSATPSVGTCAEAGGVVNCDLGTLASGTSATVVVVITTENVTCDAVVVNTATVTTTGSDPNPNNNAASASTYLECPRCPAGYDQVTVEASDFAAFPPAGWTLTNSTTGCVAPGLPDWTNTDPGARGNLTGGAGQFAIADSDACGSTSIMNATMSTGALDFTGMIDPLVAYYTDYNDISSTSDLANLDISLDGGATWSNLISWNEDHRGPLLVEQAMTGADGQGNVLLRWDYQNATWDWWWEVDDVTITACVLAAEPSIVMTKTVGLDPSSCATSSTLPIPAGYGGTDVTYCYTVENTGNITLTDHTVVDDQLGTVLGPNAAYALAPGASFSFTTTVLITETTVNVANWTAADATGQFVANATATATVTRGEPTDVTLSSFGSEQLALVPFWLVGLLVLLLGMGHLIRRRTTD